MRQRNIARRTKSIEVAVGGSVESQYLIGAASPRGHSMSSHSSSRGVERQSSRCAGRTRTAAKRDLPFGADRDGSGDARRPAAAPVLRPRLRQIQPVGDRHTRALVSPREAYRHLAVVLFAKHAAILAGHAHRVAALLGHAGVVDDPRRHRAVSLQGRQHGLTGRAQDGAIVPGGIGDEVMHRLMARAHVARIDARGHRLDALPLPGQTEPGDIGPQGAVPIPMAAGPAETLNIRVKPLGAGGPEVGHTWMLPAYPRNPLILLTQ